MRALKPGLAQRTARKAALRYKIAGGAVSFTAYSVLVPAVSLVLDPHSERPLVFLSTSVASSVMLVWGYFVSTGILARRKVLG